MLWYHQNAGFLTVLAVTQTLHFPALQGRPVSWERYHLLSTCTILWALIVLFTPVLKQPYISIHTAFITFLIFMSQISTLVAGCFILICPISMLFRTVQKWSRKKKKMLLPSQELTEFFFSLKFSSAKWVYICWTKISVRSWQMYKAALEKHRLTTSKHQIDQFFLSPNELSFQTYEN